MDPQACLTALQSAIDSEDWAEAEWAANDLREWIEKGSFPPSPFELHARVHEITDIGVRALLSLLQDQGLEIVP